MAENDGHRPHVVIVSGLSGAGKTTASKLLEDAGYTVVDNLPVELLRRLAQLVAHDSERFERLALVLDARTGNAPLAFAAAVGALEGRGIQPHVIFLEARDDILIRRFSETRHRHPLESAAGVPASVARERELLEEIRGQADVIIDTSDLSSRQLRERIYGALGAQPREAGIAIHVISFGYKHGVPLEADLVFDVRFMENPFYIDDLRPLSGQSEQVRRFVLGQPQTQRFLELMREFMAFALPAYEAEGKTRLTIGVGCTGGYHRSIAIAEAMAADLRATGEAPVSVWHRELDRE
ncbi:MAG: RNase adapter RapZ [Chloroflexota bacterium]|nr:RNase adapter RapZ [Chloroflexota bacterium]